MSATHGTDIASQQPPARAAKHANSQASTSPRGWSPPHDSRAPSDIMSGDDSRASDTDAAPHARYSGRRGPGHGHGHGHSHGGAGSSSHFVPCNDCSSYFVKRLERELAASKMAMYFRRHGDRSPPSVLPQDAFGRQMLALASAPRRAASSGHRQPSPGHMLHQSPLNAPGRRSAGRRRRKGGRASPTRRHRGTSATRGRTHGSPHSRPSQPPSTMTVTAVSAKKPRRRVPPPLRKSRSSNDVRRAVPAASPLISSRSAAFTFASHEAPLGDVWDAPMVPAAWETDAAVHEKHSRPHVLRHHHAPPPSGEYAIRESDKAPTPIDYQRDREVVYQAQVRQASVLLSGMSLDEGSAATGNSDASRPGFYERPPTPRSGDDGHAFSSRGGYQRARSRSPSTRKPSARSRSGSRSRSRSRSKPRSAARSRRPRSQSGQQFRSPRLSPTRRARPQSSPHARRADARVGRRRAHTSRGERRTTARREEAQFRPASPTRSRVTVEAGTQTPPPAPARSPQVELLVMQPTPAPAPESHPPPAVPHALVASPPVPDERRGGTVVGGEPAPQREGTHHPRAHRGLPTCLPRMPLLAHARRLLLRFVGPKALRSLCHILQPDKGITIVGALLCTLLGSKRPSWSSAQELFADPTLLDRLIGMQPAEVTARQRQVIHQLFSRFGGWDVFVDQALSVQALAFWAGVMGRATAVLRSPVCGPHRLTSDSSASDVQYRAPSPSPTPTPVSHSNPGGTSTGSNVRAESRPEPARRRFSDSAAQASSSGGEASAPAQRPQQPHSARADIQPSMRHPQAAPAAAVGRGDGNGASSEDDAAVRGRDVPAQSQAQPQAVGKLLLRPPSPQSSTGAPESPVPPLWDGSDARSHPRSSNASRFSSSGLAPEVGASTSHDSQAVAAAAVAVADQESGDGTSPVAPGTEQHDEASPQAGSSDTSAMQGAGTGGDDAAAHASDANTNASDANTNASDAAATPPTADAPAKPREAEQASDEASVAFLDAPSASPPPADESQARVLTPVHGAGSRRTTRSTETPRSILRPTSAQRTGRSQLSTGRSRDTNNVHWSELVAGRDGRPMSASRRRTVIVFVSDDDESDQTETRKQNQAYGEKLLAHIDGLLTTPVQLKAIRSILKAVMCLLGEEPSWGNARTIMARHKFATLIKRVDVSKLRPSQLQQAAAFVWVEGVDHLPHTSPPVWALAKWVNEVLLEASQALA